MNEDQRFGFGNFVILSLILAAFGTGLFFEGYYDIKYAPVAVMLLLMAGGTVVSGCLKGNIKWPFSGTSALLFLLWVYITISLAWSSVPFSSLITYLVFLSLPLCFFTPLAAANPQSLLRGAFIALATIITGIGIYAIIQHFFLNGEFGARAHKPFSDPGNLAGLLNLALLPMLALALTAQKNKIVLYAASAVLFLGLLSTESRSGLLCFIVTLPALLLILRHQVKEYWVRTLLFVVIGAALFFVAGLVNDMRFADKIIALAAGEGDSSAQARLAIWVAALQFAYDHFWKGAGFGTFYLYSPVYRLPGADNSTGNWAHMDPLQFWGELGIIAPLLFYAIAATIIIRTFRALKMHGTDNPQRVMIAGLFCGMAALALQAHLTFQFYVIPILIVFGIWLAYWHTLTGDEKSFRSAMLQGWQKPFMALSICCVAGLIGIMAVSSAAGIDYLLKAKAALRTGDTENFITYANKADSYGPASFIDPEVQISGFYIHLLSSPPGLFTAQERETMYNDTAAMLEQAEKLNPAWAEINYRKGMLYKEGGDMLAEDSMTKAESAWRETLRKNPMHFQARLELSAYYTGKGQVEEAHNIIKEGWGYPMPVAAVPQYKAVMDALANLVSLRDQYQTEKAKQQQAQEQP